MARPESKLTLVCIFFHIGLLFTSRNRFELPHEDEDRLRDQLRTAADTSSVYDMIPLSTTVLSFGHYHPLVKELKNCVDRACSKWSNRIKRPNFVPLREELAVACHRGSLDGVKRLLNDGSISYD